MNVMKAIAGIQWGAHPSVLLTVYKDWIRSLLDYGCIAFSDINGNAALILDRIQYEVIRITLRYLKLPPPM